METRTTKGVWEVVDNAIKKKDTPYIKGKEQEKLLAVGNPTNRDEFVAEVFMTHALSTFLLYASSAIILIDVWGE